MTIDDICASRRPEIEVSGTARRHARATSSKMCRIQNCGSNQNSMIVWGHVTGAPSEFVSDNLEYRHYVRH
jgi:hypothetical protein